MTPGLLATAHSLANEPSIGSSLLKMVLGLGAVIGSILVITKVLQHMKGGGGQRRGASSPLEVLSRQSLGKGLQLAVVRFNGREVLVGIAGQQISFHEPAVAGLEDDLSFLSAEPVPHAPAETAASFAAAARFAELRKGLTGLPMRSAPATAGSFLDRLRDATTRR